MPRAFSRPTCLALALILGGSLSACDAVNNTTQSAASSTRKWSDNTQRVFSGFFTLTPEPVPQLPQTRYCYQMQSDIVCYDVAQPGMTARLFGYQDGDQISFFRQGGGSLGFSAPRIMDMSGVDLGGADITSQPITTPASPSAQCIDANGQPFYCGQSPYVGAPAPEPMKL